MHKIFFLHYLRSLYIPITISLLPLILLFTDFKKENSFTIIGYALLFMILIYSRKLGKSSMDNDLQSGNMEYLLSSPMSVIKFLLTKSFWGALVISCFTTISILITKQNFNLTTIHHFGEIESIILPLLIFFDGIFFSIIPKKQQSFFTGGRIIFMFLFYLYIGSYLSKQFQTSWSMQNFSNLTHVIFYSMLMVETVNILGTLTGFLSTIFKLDIRYNITFKKFIISSYSIYLIFTLLIGIFYLNRIS